MNGFSNKIISIIKDCDCFGKPLTFRINHEREYKSLLGGLSTIIFVMISIIYVTYMTSRFLLRKNLEFIYSTKVVDEGAFLNFTDINFNLAFGVQFTLNGTNAIEKSKKYLKFSMTSNSWNGGTNNITKYHYGLKNCELSDFHVKLEKLFVKNNLNNMFCPIINETSNYTIYGGYTDIYFKFIEIQIKLSEYGIKNREEVKNYLDLYPIEMIIYFLDSSIDYKNRYNPTSIYINSLNRWLDLDLKKESQIFLSPFEFSNDENLIIANGKTLKGTIFEKSQDTSHFIANRTIDDVLGVFIVKVSPKAIQLDRTYQKIPSFIADLTSIIEEILTILILIVNYFETLLIDKKLIQKTLKFKGSKYYDIDYLLSTFHKKEINLNIINLITKQKLNIQREDQFKTTNEKTNKLINDIKFSTLFKNRENDVRNHTENLINYYNSNINETNNNNINNNNNNNKKVKNYLNNRNKNNQNTNRDSNEKHSFSNSNVELINKIGNTNLNENNQNGININNNNNVTYSNNNSYKNITSNNNNKSILKKHLTMNKHKTNNFFVNVNYGINHGKSLPKKKISSLSHSSKLSKSFSSTPNESFNLKEINICEIIFANLCSCFSYKLKKRKILFQKCEKKMYYYLDIFVYIKKIQEIDIIKYCLLDNDQIVLFDYLTTPPIKLSEKNKGVYKEFEKLQKPYIVLNKNEINKLFGIYKKIAQKHHLNFEDIKLLRLVNADIDFLK